MKRALLLLLPCACTGPPVTLDVVRPAVNDGQTASVLVRARDANDKYVKPDGKLTAVWADDEGERCRGEARVDPKDADDREEGMHVRVEFKLNHVCRAQSGKTTVTWTFEPTGGGKLVQGPADFGTGIADWDQTHAMGDRLMAEAKALAPKLEAEVKRMAGLSAIIPALGSKPETVKCPEAELDAIKAGPLETVVYDDLLVFARKPLGSPGFGVASGFYGTIAAKLDDLQWAGRSDARGETWKPVKYLEVYRVKQYEPVRRLADKKFEGGNIWGELYLVDVDAKKVLCRTPLSAGIPDKVGFTYDAFESESEKLLGQSWTARRAQAEELLLGAALTHPD